MFHFKQIEIALRNVQVIKFLFISYQSLLLGFLTFYNDKLFDFVTMIENFVLYVTVINCNVFEYL